MNENAWVKSFPAAIIVCDVNGIIIEMNDKACETYKKEGGINLIGKSIYDCHSEKAREKLKDMLENRYANYYTIEKNGIKKMICQVPWFKNEVYSGIMEMIMELPDGMPHYIR